MRKLTCIAISNIILFFSSFAQKNLQPGFITKNNSDTLQGFIDYRNWIKNPRQINFRKDYNAIEETYDFSQLSSFEISAKDQYVRFVVWKDMMPVVLSHLGNEGEEKKIRDTVFLRRLVKGDQLSLYELVDEKRHYYLQLENNEPTELPYKVFFDKNDPSTTVTLNTFRDLLKSYASGNNKLINKIEKANYKEKDLVGIVSELDRSSMVIAETNKIKTTEFFVGGGLNYNNIVFSGDNYQNINDLKASAHLSYNIRAGLDIFSIRRFQNLAIRFEIGYASYKYDGSMEREIPFVSQHEKRNYSITINSFTPRFFLNYTVIRAGNAKVYIGAGGGANFSSYPKNILTIKNETTGTTERKENFLEFEKSWGEINAHGGVVYKNLDFSLATRLTGNFANFTSIEPRLYTTGLNFSYRFHR